MNKLLMGAATVVAATALTACGSSSSGNPANDAAKAAIKAEILQQAATANGPFKMNDSQAQCTANSVVDTLGVQKMQTYGVLTADNNKATGKNINQVTLSTADATSVVNGIIGCVGNDTFTTLLKTEIDASLPATMSASQKSCIDSKFTLDVLKPVIIGQLSGHPAATSSFAPMIMAACGGTGTPSAAATATASLKAELLQQSATSASPFTFSESQAQCAASRVVNGVGTTALQSYGLLSADNKATSKTLDGTKMTPKDATAVVNAIVDCLGADTFASALRTAVSKNITGTKTASQRACLESKLTVSTLKPMLIATLSGDPSAAQAFSQGLVACVGVKK